MEDISDRLPPPHLINHRIIEGLITSIPMEKPMSERKIKTLCQKILAAKNPYVHIIIHPPFTPAHSSPPSLSISTSSCQRVFSQSTARTSSQRRRHHTSSSQCRHHHMFSSQRLEASKRGPPPSRPLR
jgi:hypothetical protein